MSWLLRLVDRIARWEAPPPMDRAAIREDLTLNDPDFKRARDVKHDLDNLFAGRDMWQGFLADDRRYERWLKQARPED